MPYPVHPLRSSCPREDPGFMLASRQDLLSTEQVNGKKKCCHTTSSLAGGIMPAFILVLMQTNRLRASKRHCSPLC